LVKRFWDGIAKTELDALSFGKVAGPEFLKLTRRFFVPDGKVLDFGAGSGDFLELLLADGLKAAGFEPSRNRTSLLVSRLGGYKDFLGIVSSRSTEIFDVVFMMEVVEHVLDHDFQVVLDRAARFVKPGGYVIVSTPNNENLEQASVFCPVSEKLFHPWQHVRSFTHQQLVGCFSGVGICKEFLALVDFSCDAELVENTKRMAARDEVRLASIRHSLASLEHLRERSQRFEIESAAAETPDSIQQVANNYLQDATAMFDNAVGVLKSALVAGVENSSVPAAVSDDGVDLRLGKETTIVFVGKKSN
jgi:SAM-dependent methyltransferase